MILVNHIIYFIIKIFKTVNLEKVIELKLKILFLNQINASISSGSMWDATMYQSYVSKGYQIHFVAAMWDTN